MGELIGDGWSIPGAVRDQVEFHWFHVPLGGSLMLCVLSSSPVWYVGHFDRGRMRRCSGEACAECGRGVGRQLRYIVSAVELTTRQVGVLELGTSPGLVLREACHRNGALHGLMIEVGRSGRSKHCRMDLVVLDEATPAWVMALTGLDLHAVLERTWERQRE